MAICGSDCLTLIAMEFLLTVEQAAERLQIAPYTVRAHLKRGQLRGVKRGAQWRIPESALLEGAPPTEPTAEAAGHLTDFLKRAEALTQRMEAAGFKGVNGAEVVRAGREEREKQLGE